MMDENINGEAIRENLIFNLSLPRIEKDLMSELRKYQEADSRCTFIKNELNEGKQVKKYQIKDGILFKINKDKPPKYYLPDKLINKIWENYHESVEAGHFGYKPTLAKIKQEFFFPKMEEIIQQKVAACKLCQQFKSKTTNEGKANADS